MESNNENIKKKCRKCKWIKICKSTNIHNLYPSFAEWYCMKDENSTN